MAAGRAQSHVVISQAMSATIVAARGAREPPWSGPGLQLRCPASEPHDNKHLICGDVRGTQERDSGPPGSHKGSK